MATPVGMHHAGTPGSNAMPQRNHGNAGGGQAAADARRTSGTGRGGERSHAVKLPAVAATTGGLFTFKRVASIQCESNVAYPLKPESSEGEYFTHWLVKALEHVGDLSAKGAPALQIISAFASRADSSCLDIIEMKYHQLRYIASPSSAMLEQYGKEDDYLPDGYETYTDFLDPNKHYAVNPSGYHYLVTKSNAWDWTFQLVCKGDLGDFKLTQDGQVAQRAISYAVQLSVVKLPKEYNGAGNTLYLGDSTKIGSKVVQIEYGELVSTSFVAWPGAKVYISDKTIVPALTKYDVWKPLRPARPDPDAEEAEEADEFALKSYGRKYCFDTIEDTLCVWFPGKKDDGEFKALCNFAIDHVMAIYQFADRERGLPWFRYKVHAVIDTQKEDVMYVTPEMDVSLKRYDDVGRIEGEVLVPLDEVDDKTLGSWFSKVSAYFRVEGFFKVEHLKALTNVLTPWPRITRVVTHFGRQPNSRLFVFGNCCYANGQIYTHEEAGVTVLPHMFGGKEVVIPMPLARFPKLLLVPQDWVRYTFFVNFWTHTLPNQFLNNTMQAKATFALGVCHLQCSKFWDGQAVGDMVPTGWLKSTAPSTGKTEALYMVNCFSGWKHKGLTMGASSSLPAVVKRLTLQKDNSLCLDEIATKVNADQEKSKKIKDIVHMCANGSSREVCGKSEEPLTTFIGSANIVVNEDDDAFLQRLLLILFQPVNAQGVDMSESAPRAREWKAAKELLSCLQPDLEEILHNGKLDREAMADWCDFMNKATSTVYSRNANLWGFLGYYMTMCEAITQGETPSLDAILEYLCTSVVRQSTRYSHGHLRHRTGSYSCHRPHCAQITWPLSTPLRSTSSSSRSTHAALLPPRTRSRRKTARSTGTVSSEKSNAPRLMCPLSPVLTCRNIPVCASDYRTTEKPEGPFHANISYIAIRLDAVCNVIKKVLNQTFKPEEIRRAVEECEWASFGRAKFYRVADLGYPITKQHMDDDTSAMMTIPLPEDELLEGHVKLERCVFFKTSKFNEIISEVENVMRDAADYKSIVIKSANPNVGSYNFYEAVTMRTDDGWYGWRGAGSTNFAKFCGVSNCVENMRSKDDLELVPGIQQLCVDGGFGGLEDIFRPSNLLQYYCYTKTPDEAMLPPAMRINPFLFRNQEGDWPMPDDERSKHYHAGLVDDYDKEPHSPVKRGRDDTLRSGDSAAQNNQDTPGSSRTPLSARGSGVAPNTPLGSTPGEAPVKKKPLRFHRRIPEDDDDEDDDRGEDLMKDDESEVSFTKI